MCGKAEGTVNHVLSKCSKLSQKEYKRRRDWFETKIHQKIYRKYGIEVKKKVVRAQAGDTNPKC